MATLTLGLKNLQRQLDDAFPDRHRPDGWIGDRAHMAHTSGHNPDDTAGSRPAWSGDPDTLAEVRALDVAADLGPGVDGRDLVDHLIGLPGLGTVIRYIIHRGRIHHARTGFRSEPYAGGNPHDHHIHFEGAWSQAADTSTFNYHLEDLVAGLTEAETRTIIREELTAFGKRDPLATMYARSGEQQTRMAATLGQLAALAGKDHVDEQAVIAGVLAGLPSDRIAAAIPAELAERVAAKLAERLAE